MHNVPSAWNRHWTQIVAKAWADEKFKPSGC